MDGYRFDGDCSVVVGAVWSSSTEEQDYRRQGVNAAFVAVDVQRADILHRS